MQLVSDFVNTKYLYEKVHINKIISKNYKEIIKKNEVPTFEDEIRAFTSIRNNILTEQFKGPNDKLLKLYKEYLFYFDIFKKKKLLKDNTILYSNNIYEKNKKVEYVFEQENIIILFNICMLKCSLLKYHKNSNDMKLLNKISNKVVDIFKYLFENMNNEKLTELTDINCASTYIFLCMALAYHENMFYNTAILKKCKRNLLSKLSYNIYTYFSNALYCLDGKMLDIFKNATKFSTAKGNIHYIRNVNNSFYNFILINKIVFISISNYHCALKYAQLNQEVDDINIQKYEEDKIGEIICRLKYSLDNVNNGIEICKKNNFSMNFSELKDKIVKSLNFFEHENKNIYFEVIPTYDKLDKLKGTEVLKVKDIDISDIYIKKNISNDLKLLFNKQAQNIYYQYNGELTQVYNLFEKNYTILNDQFKVMNISNRKNIISSLNNAIINSYNKIKDYYRPDIYYNNLTALNNVEVHLQEILNQIDANLNTEHRNNFEFQKKYVNVGINQESLNSYNSFLQHVKSFKTALEQLRKNVDTFKKFLENNHENFQICEMEISGFYKHVIDHLNLCTNVNIESLDSIYSYYQSILSEENEPLKKENELNEKNNIESTAQYSNLPSLVYTDFQTFLKENNIIININKNIDKNNLFHYDKLNNYINVHSEYKFFYVLVSIYFSLSIQLKKFSYHLHDLKHSIKEEFLNLITEEKDNDKLNELLEKEREILNMKKEKLEEIVSLFEKDLNKFYDYFHEYNKLDNFKTLDNFNIFLKDLMENCKKLNTMYERHSHTLKNALMLKDDVNKYIYMRESERSSIRIQQIPNNCPRDAHSSHKPF
ncbi:BRO1 domain-containing protein, putative [Plasmodium vinckei lentum]|uniref:BRO1 domain-containing protein, putative n=1 Tax=Plasmodium vinckei lentum TaxID=138297 RepID=A0A6V7SZS5_PLAVN|nr:BRO1 domain-containing protein, putative [Plasmodium vinckei lentum]